MTRLYLGVWALLMLLLAATVTVGDAAGLPFSLTIATLKAALVMFFYMHLRTSSSLVRLFSVGALAWLFLLFFLTLCDVLTRSQPP